RPERHSREVREGQLAHPMLVLNGFGLGIFAAREGRPRESLGILAKILLGNEAVEHQHIAAFDGSVPCRRNLSGHSLSLVVEQARLGRRVRSARLALNWLWSRGVSGAGIDCAVAEVEG